MKIIYNQDSCKTVIYFDTATENVALRIGYAHFSSEFKHIKRIELTDDYVHIYDKDHPVIGDFFYLERMVYVVINLDDGMCVREIYNDKCTKDHLIYNTSDIKYGLIYEFKTSVYTYLQLKSINRDKMTRGNISKYIPEIDKVIFNDPATIVYFKDGTKTVVKRNGNGEYDEFSGLTAALAKRIYGLKELNKHIPEKKEEPQLDPGSRMFKEVIDAWNSINAQYGDFNTNIEEFRLNPNEVALYDCKDELVQKSNLKLWSFDVDENEFKNEHASQGKYIYRISVDRKHLRIIYITGTTEYGSKVPIYSVYKLEDLKTILICLRDNEDNYKTLELSNIDGNVAPSIDRVNLINEFDIIHDLMKADCNKKIKDRDLNLKLRGNNEEEK